MQNRPWSPAFFRMAVSITLCGKGQQLIFCNCSLALIVVLGAMCHITMSARGGLQNITGTAASRKGGS